MTDTFDGLETLSLEDIGPISSGENLMVCPNCSHHRKYSPHAKVFSVNGDHGAFFCSHCQFSGILEDFKTHKRGDRSGASKKKVSEGVRAMPKPRPKEVNKTVPREDLDQSVALSDAAIDYMSGRGISERVLREMRVHSSRQWGEEAIVFPALSRDGKDLIHFKYRNFGKHGDKTRRFKTSIAPDFVFFGLNRLDEEPDQIIICEGEIDMYSFIEAGFRNVLSVPNGGGKGKLDRPLESAAKEIASAKSVILALDPDKDGVEMRDELVRRIGPKKCKVVQYPEGCKDANDTLVSHGIVGVVEMVSGAKDYQVPGIIRPNDVRDGLKARIGKPIEQGVAFPNFPKISDICRIADNHLYVVSGAPNSGKSSIVRRLCLDLASDKSDYAVAFFASEDSGENEDFFSLWVSLLIGKYPEKCTETEIDYAMDMLQGRVVLFQVEAGNFDEIIEKARYSIIEDNVKVLVIDPWTEVEINTNGGRENQKVAIDRHISYLRDFGKQHKIAIIVVVHPNAQDGRAMASGGEASQYAIANTSGWTNKADMIILFVRTNDDRLVFEVAKCRRVGRIGKRGKVVLTHDPVTGRYEEVNPQPVAVAS